VEGGKKKEKKKPAQLAQVGKEKKELFPHRAIQKVKEARKE